MGRQNCVAAAKRNRVHGRIQAGRRGRTAVIGGCEAKEAGWNGSLHQSSSLVYLRFIVQFPI